MLKCPPQPVDASELDELSRAPRGAHTAAVSPALTRQGIREAAQASEQARLACIRRMQIRLMVDYPFSWRRRFNKGG